LEYVQASFSHDKETRKEIKERYVRIQAMRVLKKVLPEFHSAKLEEFANSLSTSEFQANMKTAVASDKLAAKIGLPFAYAELLHVMCRRCGRRLSLKWAWVPEFPQRTSLKL
jgi:hypothetical protein